MLALSGYLGAGPGVQCLRLNGISYQSRRADEGSGVGIALHGGGRGHRGVQGGGKPVGWGQGSEPRRYNGWRPFGMGKWHFGNAACESE